MLFRKKSKVNINEESTKRTYTTDIFLLQVLMSDIDGVEIVGFERNGFDKGETITFTYDNVTYKRVQTLLTDFYNGLFYDVKVEGFAEMKQVRKKKINDYFKRLKAGFFILERL